MRNEAAVWKNSGVRGELWSPSTMHNDFSPAYTSSSNTLSKSI